MENPLYTLLKEKYHIGHHFIAAYLTHMLGMDALDVETYNQKLAQNPRLAVYVDYGFSTNLRGRIFAERIKSYFPQNASRYLDVGSAYGGFLIGFMQLGFEVVGLEVDEKLVGFSRANFEDHGLTGGSTKGDILDDSLVPGLGKFDVISCADVIEHVNDASKALKNMTGLLNPGGILVLEVPNKDSLSNIMSDLHYGLFGITLLERPDAKRFKSFHSPQDPIYDVGECYRLEYYAKELGRFGCQVSILPPMVTTRLTNTARLIPQYLSKLAAFSFKHPVSVPLLLKLKVIFRALSRLAEFMIGLPVAKLSSKKWKQMKLRFSDDTWLILATKA